ncbi:MAG: chemotaxis protein CheB [Chitinophagaceae bacterium]|nr:chemotaxis protein CheB [Chitinophagaceae bacterium]
MAKRNIIVIGASAGGFQAIKKLVADLPPSFDASIFIVWHMAANVRGVLPEVLNRLKTMPSRTAVDHEHIRSNCIYVAPPDRHLVIEGNHVRVTRGPKENRFRPAVDPLFRSAALQFGERVIGIVLSGALDDGTSGLWTIKQHGGMAMVQDPDDAEISSMPENAINNVDVDEIIPIAQMAERLVALAAYDLEENKQNKSVAVVDKNERTRIEVEIALEKEALRKGVLSLGDFTPYTCPECHGVLCSIKDGAVERFRCHTGHAFSTDSLLAAITENIEESLWNAIRVLEESVLLLNHMGDHFSEVNQPKVAAMYFKKAQEANDRTKRVRKSVFAHENLSDNSIRAEADPGGEEARATG